MRDISSQYRLWLERADHPFSPIIGVCYFTFLSIEIHRLTCLLVMEAKCLPELPITNRDFSQTHHNTRMPILSNFYFAVPSEMNKANEVCNHEIYVEIQSWQ